MFIQVCFQLCCISLLWTHQLLHLSQCYHSFSNVQCFHSDLLCVSSKSSWKQVGGNAWGWDAIIVRKGITKDTLGLFFLSLLKGILCLFSQKSDGSSCVMNEKKRADGMLSLLAHLSQSGSVSGIIILESHRNLKCWMQPFQFQHRKKAGKTEDSDTLCWSNTHFVWSILLPVFLHHQQCRFIFHFIL